MIYIVLYITVVINAKHVVQNVNQIINSTTINVVATAEYNNRVRQ